MHVGDTVETSLADHFSPRGCVEAFDYGWAWALRSSDPSAVAVSVSENVLEIAALAVADSVRISVGITGIVDPRDEDDPPHEFLVRVRPR